MVNGNAIKKGFKDIGLYSVLLVGSLLASIISAIVVGYMDEKVIPALGLTADGAAAVFIGTVLTTLFAGLTGIMGIATLASGLAILNVLVEMFGFKIKFGSGNKDY